MATLLKVDKNETEYWQENKCPKCGGSGHIYGYEHVEGGICFKCNGSGHFPHSWKKYTPEYQAVLNDRAAKRYEKKKAELVASAPERIQKFFHKEGFNTEGHAWVVLGNTFSIKDDLKNAGCRWNNQLGWHFNHEQDTFQTIKVHIDEFCNKDDCGDYCFDEVCAIQEYIKEQKQVAQANHKSEFQGNIGEKIEKELTLVKSVSFETHFTYYGETQYIHKFEDEDGNIYIWKTSNALVEDKPIQKCILKGTIKEHSEYNTEKQTVLTRCKVKEILKGEAA